MVDPLRTQNSYLNYVGQLDYYRSGAAGKIRNDGDVRQINGYAIDVSGTPSGIVVENSFQPGKGVTWVKSAPPQQNLSPSTMGDLIQRQGANFQTADIQRVMNKESSGITVTTTGEGLSLPQGVEPQSVEGLGFLPPGVDVHNPDAYYKSQIERNGELANIEAGLRKEYKADVKVAYDPLSGEYMMLRPGQAFYDHVKSAEEIFAQTRSDLQGMEKHGLGSSHRFDDVLTKYEMMLQASDASTSSTPTI